MARIAVDGLEIDYELIGPEGGRPLVLTPGGRYPRDTAGVPELGRIFADQGRPDAVADGQSELRTGMRRFGSRRRINAADAGRTI